MSTFGDGRESAGLVCTEVTVGAAMLGILEVPENTGGFLTSGYTT